MRILTGQFRSPVLFFDTETDGGTGTETPTKKVGGREQVHVSEGAREFGKRFAPPADVAARAAAQKSPETKVPLTAPADETPEQKAEREKAQETRRAADPSAKREPHRKPGENLPKILEDKRRAEAALAEKEAAISKYEKEEIPQLNARISDLQAQIDSGAVSPKREAELQKRIDALEKEKTDRESSLVNELDATKKRLAQLSIPDDPIYREKYVKPLAESIDYLTNMVGANQVLQNALKRAMMSQRSVLDTATPEDRSAAEMERDNVVESILNGMNTVSQRRFTQAFEKFIDASEKQAYALADHERTAQELREESTQRYKQGVQKTLTEWLTEFDDQAADFSDDMKLTDDDAKSIKDLGINLDVEAENKFAKAAIEGGLGKKDVVKLVHRGRAYPVLKAKVASLAARVKEQAETIEKLRGASPAGGGRGSEPRRAPTPGVSPQGVPTNREGKTREQWQAERFRPPNP
jgi:hypothetical protein